MRRKNIDGPGYFRAIYRMRCRFNQHTLRDRALAIDGNRDYRIRWCSLATLTEAGTTSGSKCLHLLLQSKVISCVTVLQFLMYAPRFGQSFLCLRLAFAHVNKPLSLTLVLFHQQSRLLVGRACGRPGHWRPAGTARAALPHGIFGVGAVRKVGLRMGLLKATSKYMF